MRKLTSETDHRIWNSLKSVLKRRFESRKRRRTPRVLVVGLGNFLLRDDGVGVHAVRRFQQLKPTQCLAIELGTAIFNGIHLIEKADRIIAFDAIEAEGKPGSVYLLRAEDARREERHDSLHEIGLIKVLQTLHRPTAEVVIIGAEPQIIDWGMELSPAVDSAVAVMISTAQKVIADWQSHNPRFDSRYFSSFMYRRPGTVVK